MSFIPVVILTMDTQRNITKTMKWFWTPAETNEAFWGIVANGSWNRPFGPVFLGKQNIEQSDFL